MNTRKQTFGRKGEEMACNYLESRGYCIFERNYYSAHGEIDIIAWKDSSLIFVEVRTRRSHEFAYPEESVTKRKQAHMLAAAEVYLQAHPESSESWQFDVIAIIKKPGQLPEISHFENIIA